MERLENLKGYLQQKESLVVAFSGGVDSAFLLKVAHQVLGEHVVAVTVKPHSFPLRELREAEEFCRKEGIRHIIREVDELQIPGFAKNPPERCYLCKRVLMQTVCETAGELGISHVAEASNLDDNGDYRPGMRAIAELGILSPLRETGIDKKTIRELSRKLGLAVWDKPSFACLATRFVYGETITRDKLAMLDAAEQFLFEQGFRQVRVRIHGEETKSAIARIEVAADEFPKMFAQGTAQMVHERLKEIGFAYVTLDLGGYRMGSMNDKLKAASCTELST